MKEKGMGINARSRAGAGVRPACARMTLAVFVFCTVLAICIWVSPALAQTGEITPATDASGITTPLPEQPVASGQGDLQADPAVSSTDPGLPADGPVVCDADPLTVETDLGALTAPGGSTGTDTGPAGPPAVAGQGVKNDAAEDAPAPVDGGGVNEAAPAAELALLREGDGGGSETETDEECCDVEAYLELICGKGPEDVFWASMDDYNAGLLTIRYILTNTGTEDLYDLRVSVATATNGVTVSDPLPMSLGDLPADDWLKFTLKWQLPSKNVTNFVTDITICADCEPEEPVCEEGDDCDPEEPVCEGEECEPEEPICADCNPQDPDPGLTSSGGAAPVATGFHASALPNTGFDLLTALLVGFGFLTPMGVLITIGARRVPVRRK